MKRQLLITAIISLICSMNVSAQESTQPMWGIKAAGDLNLPGDWHTAGGSVDMHSHGFGATLGAVYNVYLGRNFYLEPGVSLFYDSYSYKGITITEGPDGFEHEAPSLYKVGLRIPIVAGYTITPGERFSMSVYTGPELSYAFAGDVRFRTPLLDDSDFNLFGQGGMQRHVDCAWKIGIGFPMDAWFISFDASFGITDLLKIKGISFRENRCSLGLTRYF